MQVRIVHTTDRGFEARFARLCRRLDPEGEAITAGAARIVADVRARGDAALVEHTARLDGWRPRRPGDLEVSAAERRGALRAVDRATLASLRRAAARIEAFHRRQRETDRLERTRGGGILGWRVLPLERAGLYVPGGTAAYPSTVLMTALPARVAGVGELVVTTPAPGGVVPPLTLAACELAGVDRIFKLGGAQAVGALAFGTRLVPRVDKIAGPGNAWVAAAKRQVYGHVDLDMVAGPSEVLVVADRHAPAAHVAADLLAQAEHDERALAVLVTDSARLARDVAAQLELQLAALPRRVIAGRSIAERGLAVVARSLAEALELANRFAAEHLELFVRAPRRWLARVRHAGAIFLGGSSPEPVGDYLAGPSHVLPTAGTARYASPLGVYDFVRRTSVIGLSPGELARVGADVVRLARAEGLAGHARAVELRLEVPRRQRRRHP